MNRSIEGNILIVDDTPNNLSVLRQILTKHGHLVRPALNGHIALSAVQADLPDLILLDIIMPDMDGYEVCKALKTDEKTRDIPVIFISALNDLGDKVRAFEEGGVDYISKPFHAEEVMARVNTHLVLRAQQKALVVQNEQLKEKNALIQRQAEELKELASIDFLTGLSNRREFLRNFQQEEIRFKRTQRHFSIIMIDIDHFKKINDRFGHDCGDMVLKGVAKTIKQSLRDQDIVARWGGEEFICLLPETDMYGACNAAEKMRQGLASTTHDCTTGRVSVTATFGVSLYDGNSTLEACINLADKALYKGKQEGRNLVATGS